MEEPGVGSTGIAQTLLEVAPVTLPLFPSYREIPLTHGQVAIVDESDYEKLSAHKWHAFRPPHSKNWYAVREAYREGEGPTRNRRYRSHMHRVILDVDDCKKHLFVDHINGNGLDNRRSNLRLVTHSQNHMNERRRSDNASGHKGVSRASTISERWQANITANGKTHYLGIFPTIQEAIEARREAGQKLHGEYARRA